MRGVMSGVLLFTMVGPATPNTQRLTHILHRRFRNGRCCNFDISHLILPFGTQQKVDSALVTNDATMEEAYKDRQFTATKLLQENGYLAG
jgi:hypothetical protein